MLAVALIGLYTLLIVVGWGLGSERLLRRLLIASAALPLGLAGVALLGFAAVTTAASAISLFAPTALLTSGVLLAGALAGVWFGRRDGESRFAFPKMALLAAVLGLVTLAGVLNGATLPASNPDTGIYHAQAVRWIESYPAVPGLGNFHARLAYNSSWFVTTAAFSLSFLKIRSFHLSGSVLFGVAGLYFLTGVNDLVRGRFTLPALLKTAFFPLATYLLAGDLSSPTPDLPAVLLAWACFVLYVEIACEPPSADTASRDALLMILATFAVTVKLSALPVLLLPFLRLFRLGWRRRAALAGLAALVALPWLARNVILSGYPVFPGLTADLFHLDWRVPAQIARAEKTGITNFARLPHLPGSEVAAMPLRVWAVQWFHNLTANRQLVFLAALFSPVVMGATLLAGVALRRRNDRLWQLGLRVLPAWVAAYAGMGFWFLTAPAIRFGYAFLSAAPLLAALPLLAAVGDRLGGRARRVGALAALLLLILYQGAALALSLDAPTLAGRLALPADYTNLPTQPCKTGHLAAFCPSQWQECGYEVFPCAPALNPQVVMRGKDWQDGFRSLEVSP